MASLPILRMTRVLVPSSALALLGLTLAPVASAQDEGGVNISVSPRLYVTALDAGAFAETATGVLGGLSVTVGPAGRNWDISLNGLAGSGDSDFGALALSPISGWGQSGTYEYDRADYEILYRYRLEDSPVYVGFGYRDVEIEETYTGDISGLLETETTDLSMVEFALGFSTQASEGSKHGVFGNLLLGFGSFDYLSEEIGFADSEDDGSAILADANVGYQYLMNRKSAFSARYRVIAVQTNGEESESSLVHGW